MIYFSIYISYNDIYNKNISYLEMVSLERVILHSDINSCYASIEILHHPELRGKPVAVGGDPEARHGIVLAKDDIAKKCGVKTGMALWQAKRLCPEITILPPRMDLYLRFSAMAHELYADYTDMQQSFGIDESWLDVTGSCSLFGDGFEIAKEINRRMKEELGITVSIGVSWNKIFAKLGSDYKKPDAITVISKENYKSLVWPLPAKELLYVGRSTERKLITMGVNTIGDLARMDPKLLKSRLGKIGVILHSFASGNDTSPVLLEDYSSPIKSIGNSTTTPRDLESDDDVWLILYILSESVGRRLRDNGFKCSVVEISIRDNELYCFSRQKKLFTPTNVTKEIVDEGFKLFKESYNWHKNIRSIGIRGADLVIDSIPIQTDIFMNSEKRIKQEKMDEVVDEIRKRFGYTSIQRAVMYTDKDLSRLNPHEEHVVHPHGYF